MIFFTLDEAVAHVKREQWTVPDAVQKYRGWCHGDGPLDEEDLVKGKQLADAALIAVIAEWMESVEWGRDESIKADNRLDWVRLLDRRLKKAERRLNAAE